MELLEREEFLPEEVAVAWPDISPQSQFGL